MPKNGETFDLSDLLDLLSKVDLDNEYASLNEVTISDNNGGRIEL